MPNFNDLTAKRFGRWQVIGLTGKSKSSHQTLWHCRCDCGKEKTAVLYTSLVGGGSTSCGCFFREKLARPDGPSKRSLYKVWQGIKTRCFNTNHPSYTTYGARGITMDPAWVNDFLAFEAHMGPKPNPGDTVERVDNSRGYFPDNVVWASRATQNRNRRNNVNIKWQGKTRTLDEICTMENVDYASMYMRTQKLKHPMERAIEHCRHQNLPYKVRRKSIPA